MQILLQYQFVTLIRNANGDVFADICGARHVAALQPDGTYRHGEDTFNTVLEVAQRFADCY